MACRRCSNYMYILILDLTPGLNEFGKDSRNTRRETFQFLDSVLLLLEVLWQFVGFL